MTTLALSREPPELRDALHRVRDEGDRVVIEEDGQPVGALVSLDDLRALEEMEDLLDEKAALAALAESDDRIPYEAVRKELGL